MRRSTKQPGLAAAEFQAQAAATGKARSPIVVRHVDDTNRETDSVERNCRPEERLQMLEGYIRSGTVLLYSLTKRRFPGRVS